MPIKLNSTGGGSVTVDVPSTASTFTATLPAATGNVVLDSATQTLTNKSIVATQLTGTIAAARLPAGSIIQVVQSTNAGSSSTTSTTYVDVTNFTVTITPTSSTNKIIILASSFVGNTLVASTNVRYYQQLLRTSTTLQEFQLAAESAAGGLQAAGNFTFSYLDSPATTSATTYKVQHRVTSASSTGTTAQGWIIALEVVA